MRLWLEEVIDQYRSGIDHRDMPFRQRKAMISKGRGGEHVRQMLFEQVLRADALRQNWFEPARDLAPADFPRLHADLRRRLAPFVLPELADRATALNVHPETVREFIGAATKPSITELGQTELRKSHSTYLDFPGKAATLEHGWHVRAVVITQESNSTSKWTAALQFEDESPFMLMTWYVRGKGDHYPGSLFGHDNSFDLLDSCGRWSQDIARLVYLCIAWLVTSRNTGTPKQPSCQGEPPRHSHHATRLSILSKETLLRVVHLPAPRLRKAVNKSDGSCTATAHIIVRGHFKIVRFGKQKSRSRLQWIEAYEKGDRTAPLQTRTPLYKI